MNTPDGLTTLQANRDKASARHAPPPRHQPPRRPEAPASSATPPRSRARPAAPAAPARIAQEPLVRASIYLDRSADEFLEDIRTAGRRAVPKVDASRSAVVRLALDRLAAELGPGDVVDALRERASVITGPPGRKRL